ncbi:MAG: ABC transporter permease [Thermoflexales bacterium]|nr:ABC transporter permease [Thermoflexales bacterium]
MALYLALKEMWRNRGRFILVSLVIALITVLVLFTAALAEGLGSGNREYIQKLDADLLVYKEKVDLIIATSRVDRPTYNDIRRVGGVREVGSLSFSNVSIVLEGSEPLKVALIGVEPGKPGEPSVRYGSQLRGKRANEAIIDSNVAAQSGLRVGDELTIKSIQGTREELYTLRVAGTSSSQKYSLQPSVFVPYETFDQIKPQAVLGGAGGELASNIVAVKLDNPAGRKLMAARIQSQVKEVEAVDLQTAYESTPGYSAQQNTLNTQQYFVFIISILVIGGFFQIQTLQKVAQIGMLKAIGTPNGVIAVAAAAQIVATTLLGVAIGVVVTLALSVVIPPVVPIIFSPLSAALVIPALILMGPMGGMVSILHSLRIEPLTALGLAS